MHQHQTLYMLPSSPLHPHCLCRYLPVVHCLPILKYELFVVIIIKTFLRQVINVGEVVVRKDAALIRHFWTQTLIDDRKIITGSTNLALLLK